MDPDMEQSRVQIKHQDLDFGKPSIDLDEMIVCLLRSFNHYLCDPCNSKMH